jgi:hypothetical protein
MARFTIIAHEAEFQPAVAGIRFVKFQPCDPILHRECEAKTLAEIKAKLDAAGAELKATGRSFVATVVHVRNSGRKPAGFDDARLKISYDAPADSSPSNLGAVA